MSNNQTDVQPLSFRRKIITTSSKILSRHDELAIIHHDEVDCGLRPNLHLARSAFPILITQNQSFRITKSISQKPFLVPNKQNIDYSSLFERKLVGLKTSKTSLFLPGCKLTKKIKEPQNEEIRVKARLSPAKYFQKKRQSLSQKRIDVNIQTMNMMKGLCQKDLEAFVLLLNQSEQQRRKKAISRWQTFNTQKFIKIYSKQYFN